MHTLQIFFAEWWPLSVGGGAVFVTWSLVNGEFLHLSPKLFRELAGFSDEQQKGLLQQATKEAFHGWRSVLSPIAFALVVSTAVALGGTIPKLTALPDTWWAHIPLAGLFAGVAAWFQMRIEVRRVRPFLQRLLERTTHAA